MTQRERDRKNSVLLAAIRFFPSFSSTHTRECTPQAPAPLTNPLRSMSIDVTSQWSNIPLIKFLSSATTTATPHPQCQRNAVHYVNFHGKCLATFWKLLFRKKRLKLNTNFFFSGEKSNWLENENLCVFIKQAISILPSLLFTIDLQQRVW